MKAEPVKHVFYVSADQERQRIMIEILEGFGIKVECFASPWDCLKKLVFHSCDLLILERGANVLAFMSKARDFARHLPVLVIGHPSPRDILQAVKSDTDYFSGKAPDKLSFLYGVRSLDAGETCLLSERVSQLTETETRIAELLTSGMAIREISLNMRLAVKTIAFRRRGVLRKLGLRERPQVLPNDTIIE